MIELYNSKTQKVELFKPIHDDHVTMYVCGPTVYGPAHIGNARPAIVFDILFRTLLDLGYRVRYASNITDIDDKIIAALDGRNLYEFTEEVYRQYLDDLEYLNVKRVPIAPKATNYIAEMQDMIVTLMSKGHAYEVQGEVFFHVPSNPHTGLMHHGAGGLRPGDRVAVDPRKKDPRDFVLWKPAKPGEHYWTSPWGDGRPGWHIECSAMIEDNLGDSIDIHGGGLDLKFPHHEAEMAQSQCAHDGQVLANYWVHNGLLTVDGKKMSKSEGNTILVGDLKPRFHGESIRFYMMGTHYRSPMNWTRMGLQRAHRTLSDFYQLLYDYRDVVVGEVVDVRDRNYVISKLKKDLNTPGAIADLHVLAKKLREDPDKARWIAALKYASATLGLLQDDPSEWIEIGVDTGVIQALIEQRNQMREQRDFAGADQVREKLAHMGITLADGAHGTEWRKT